MYLRPISSQHYIATQGLQAYKELAYNYSRQFEHSCILDSCQLNTGVYAGKYEFLAAFGAEKVYTDYTAFGSHLATNKDWLFGVLGYDLKNNFEKLDSNNQEIISCPELSFFVPQIVIAIDKNNNVGILKGKLTDAFWDTERADSLFQVSAAQSPITKEIYLNKIAQIHNLIYAGEVYELNYCVPFKHEYLAFDPISFHQKLIQKSPVPMAAYLRADHLHLCGASMERFLLRDGEQLISQPIKGTIRKGDNTQEDEALINELENSEKDRAENVMIVDLVRNDLARVSIPGQTQVEELFGVYSYLQVHQMISTIKSTVSENTTVKDILEATFPMGSMTGTPKIAAMQHIEELEDFKRGWYSGALGYISPTNDFDFNVVIRTMLCDEQAKTLNYNAGGAITIDSEAEKEWDEVQLKIKAIKEVLAI